MKHIICAAVLGAFSLNAGAAELPPAQTDYDPTAMFGLTYSFSGPLSLKNLGFTLKALSSNQENRWVFGAGVSFFPWSNQKLGIDVGAGRNFEDSNCLVGWDFMLSQPTVSCGATNTKEKQTTPTSAPT